MKLKTLSTFFILCLFLTGCLEEKTNSTPAQMEIGRFSIFEKDGRTFLLDTVEGKSWRFAYINKIEGGEMNPIDWVWSPILRFPDQGTLGTYMSLIQEKPKERKLP